MITSKDLSLLSRESTIAIIKVLLPRKLGPTTTPYDVGYESAKADIARVIGSHIGVDFSDNPARQMLKALERGV